jgi:hypothetical protein
LEAAPTSCFFHKEKKMMPGRLQQLNTQLTFHTLSQNLTRADSPSDPEAPDSNTIKAETANRANAPEFGPWQPPTRDELSNALGQADPLLAKRLSDTPGADRWLDSMCDCLKEKSGSMKTDEPGFEFFMRFKAAYNDIHHLAYGTAWRDGKDQLRAAVMHQESIPPKGKGEPFTGQVFSSLDTSSLMPGGQAPADISMRFVGMPDVNIFPVKQPDQLPSITGFLDGASHPYGLTDNETTNRLASLPDVRPVNCFQISQLASEALQGQWLKYPEEDALPHSLINLGPKTCTDLSKNSNLTVKGVSYDINKAGQFEDAVRLGLAIRAGQVWGNDGQWDVPSPLAAASVAVNLKSGQQLPVPPYAAGVKFTSTPSGLLLDGKQVSRGPYSATDAAQMKYEGKGPLKLSYLYSFIRGSDEGVTKTPV